MKKNIDPASKSRGQGMYSWFLAILILFSLYQGYRVFSPFLTPIIVAVVLAGVFSPLFVRLSARFQGRDTLAAVVVLVIVIVCVILPTCFFLTGLVSQGVDSIAAVNDWITRTDFTALRQDSRFQALWSWAEESLPFLDLRQIDFQSTLLGASRTIGQKLIQTGTQLLGNAVSIFFYFLMMLFILFFLLKDGRKMVTALKYLSPLREEQEDRILLSLRRVGRSVLVGGLLVAFLQGLAGGIGLAIVGLPALFWGTMMGFASLVPVLGTGIIWVPACLYLLVMGNWGLSLFLALYCGLLVTSIDTFLRPYFMRGASGLSMMYIFLSVIGGLQVFGPAGLLYGPLILSFALVMLRIYGEEYRDVLEKTTPDPVPAEQDAVPAAQDEQGEQDAVVEEKGIRQATPLPTKDQRPS